MCTAHARTTKLVGLIEFAELCTGSSDFASLACKHLCGGTHCVWWYVGASMQRNRAPAERTLDVLAMLRLQHSGERATQPSVHDAS